MLDFFFFLLLLLLLLVYSMIQKRKYILPTDLVANIFILFISYLSKMANDRNTDDHWWWFDVDAANQPKYTGRAPGINARYDYHVIRKVKNGSVICLGNLRRIAIHSISTSICRTPGATSAAVVATVCGTHVTISLFNGKQVNFVISTHFIS